MTRSAFQPVLALCVLGAISSCKDEPKGNANEISVMAQTQGCSATAGAGGVTISCADGSSASLSHGLNGTPGAIGTTGNTGSTGTNGAQGSIGATGSSGNNGAAGQPGSIGPTGPNGPTGAEAITYVYNLNGAKLGLARLVGMNSARWAETVYLKHTNGETYAVDLSGGGLLNFNGLETYYFSSTDCTGTAYIRPSMTREVIALHLAGTPAKISRSTPLQGAMTTNSYATDGVTCTVAPSNFGAQELVAITPIAPLATFPLGRLYLDWE